MANRLFLLFVSDIEHQTKGEIKSLFKILFFYCTGQDLKQGLNLIGIACPSDGYTAFQQLNDLGAENATTIQRYDAENGTFASAGFNEIG